MVIGTLPLAINADVDVAAVAVDMTEWLLFLRIRVVVLLLAILLSILASSSEMCDNDSPNRLYGLYAIKA